MQWILETLRISSTLAALLYASWSDYKKREVSNSVWISYAPLALTLTITELSIYEDFQTLQFYGLSFGLTAALAIILFYAGGFGGADAKALMCLALALPFYPQNIFTPVFKEISPIAQTFFPLTVFNNSILLAAATAIYILLYNIVWHKKNGKKLFEEFKNESFGKKILVLITSYKMPIQKIKEKWHIYPMEDIEDNTEEFNRKLVVIPKDEERNTIIERLEKAAEKGKIQNTVWATPGLPMLIFITAGLIIALFIGDIIWICIDLIL
ncbi:MAG: A24 family peptidase C-terminal domain-containing protein [Candidatus Bathyarchaeales archaeon]